jgi:exopolyphosphatase/guanosine-5'-triphosphate,3'-diphosphate pyrophosphatase
MTEPELYAAVDIGTNSTRLLVCSVTQPADGGRPQIADLERHSTVTRLGDGVDATGTLSAEAMERVLRVLEDYRKVIDLYPVRQPTGVLTSAGRDAANGQDLCDQILDRTGIQVRLIGGDEEANLSFSGATSEVAADGRTLLVVDVGGGSTELITGSVGHVAFHTSLDAGVVRHSERYLHSDPPTAAELAEAATEITSLLAATVPLEVRESVDACIAVAGTATTLSAIDQELEPYDPNRVHGATVDFERSQQILDRIASLPLSERREVAGLHPDRAPTAVAGAVILCEVLDFFELDEFEASEHDILRGEVLRSLTSQSP